MKIEVSAKELSRIYMALITLGNLYLGYEDPSDHITGHEYVALAGRLLSVEDDDGC